MIKEEDIPEGSLLDQTTIMKQVCDISNWTVSHRHHGNVSDNFISIILYQSSIVMLSQKTLTPK